MKIPVWFAAIVLSACAATLYAAPAPNAPRVAVFAQAGFPYYNASPLLRPKKIAADLEAAGVQADLLDTDALADPTRLSAQRYAAVVLPYGNAFPQNAFANLQTFHRAGGGLVLSGIPFTHPVQRQNDGSWKDLGHSDAPARFGPDGIGVGGFAGAPDGGAVVASGDPLGLQGLGRDWSHGGSVQTLDVPALPAEDQVIPILTEAGRPAAALIVHHDPAYNGAVDVWTNHPVVQGLESYDDEQFLVRGTLAALVQKGLFPAPRQQMAFASLDKFPRPQILANLTLPTPPRPYPTFQPKTPPPARHLYVADVRHLGHDQQLLLASLQGIVNRTQPRIYLISEDNDQFWLDAMQQQGQTGTPIPVADPLALVRQFRSAIRGAVVADPKVYVSPCVAVDLAGLDDLVIATPELAAQLKLPIKSDLRGKFKDDADAFRYVRITLLPRLNPYLSLCLDPVLLGSQVDDVIAAKGMAFWITGPKAQDRPGADEAAEQAEIEKTFARLPLNAVVRGFWWHGDGVGVDEGPGVSLGSRFGKVTTVSDYVADFSVLSGVPMPRLTQKPQTPAPALDPAKVYIALTMSDGDNLCTWRGYFRSYFTDPLHGTFPIAWGMGPTLLDVAPTIAQWYYQHATPNDEFLCDVSGVGYIYPPDFATALQDRNGALQDFYNWTQRYMQRMDMATVRLMNVRTQDIPAVGADLPGVPFLMPDYGWSGEKDIYSEYTYTLPTGQPVFRAITTSGSGAQNLADQVRKRIGTTRPAFANVFIWNWGSKLADIKQMLDILGPEYVAVSPSHLNALYRQSQAGATVKPAANRE